MNDEELARSLNEHIDEHLSKYFEVCKLSSKRAVDRDLLFIKMALTVRTLASSPALESELISELVKTFYPELSAEGSSRKSSSVKYISDMKILRKLHGRRRVTVSQIFSERNSASDVLDYIWLRKEGFLQRGGGFLRVDPSISSVDCAVKERAVDLGDVVKYLDEVPSRLWKNVVDQSFLERLDSESFLKLLHKVYGRSASVDQRIARELERRVESGWKLDWSSSKKLERVFERKRSLLASKYLGPHSLKWIKPESLTGSLYERALSDIKSLPLRERWKVVSGISNRRYERLLERLDPITLSAIENPLKYSASVKNKALIGQSVVSYINFLITGSSSYLDYSKHILSKVSAEQLDPTLRPMYRSLLSGDYKSAIYFMSKNFGVDAIELIAESVWRKFSTEGFSEEALWRAMKIGYEVLKYRIRGPDRGGNYKHSSVHGRLVVRKTVYNFARGNYSLVRKYREREAKLVVLVDTSGSMMKHSLWAILALCSIVSSVKIVGLFSDKILVSRPPRSFTRPLIVSYLKSLFSDGFKGYTNISMAFREIAKHVNSRDVLVLFSDLEQTVPDVDPVVEVERLARTKGSKIVVFVPPVHKSEARNELSRVGVDVTVVDDPSKIPRLLRRKLNIKIRLNIFST